jgi:hypothetical protein
MATNRPFRDRLSALFPWASTTSLAIGRRARPRICSEHMESDIDLLVITDPKANPDMTDEAVDRLAADIRKWTGNNVQIVDRNPDELAAMIASDDPLVASWRADHIDLMGARLLDLLRDLQRAS